jgi:hypothetical protein
MVFHRERTKSINPQLLALKKEGEITKPPTLGRAQNQSSKQLGSTPPLCAQLWTSSPPPFLIQASRDPHTPSPLLRIASSDATSWPRYGHLETMQKVKQPGVRPLQSIKQLGARPLQTMKQVWVSRLSVSLRIYAIWNATI